MSNRVAVLISGSGSNLQAIMDAVESGRLNAEIVLVVSNRSQAFGLTRAMNAHLPTRVHRLKPYLDAGRDRLAYDADLAAIVLHHDPDWIVLAGWMHILSHSFLAHFPNRVINLHPALPGQFPGTHAIERAYADAQEHGRRETGIMVHLVPDEAVDAGPVLATRTVPIFAQDTLPDLEERIHLAEHELLVETLQRLLNPPS